MRKESPTPPRLATPADIPGVIALEREVPGLVHWSEETYSAIFKPGAAERILWVIEERGQLEAFVVARFALCECEVENLVVAAGSRRRGLAATLLEVLIAEAHSRHLERILLEVRPSNSGARALYERFGFRIEGKRKNYYSQPPEDAIVLALALNCTSPSAPNR